MPTLCIHSPHVEAQQAASLIARGLGLPHVVSQDLLAPGQTDCVSGYYLSEESGHQLVVGHQPYLSQLISACATPQRTSVLRPVVLLSSNESRPVGAGVRYFIAYLRDISIE